MLRPCFFHGPQSMPATRVKVCGITRAQDAESAVAAGVHALGMVFYPPSGRAVTIEQARQIAAVVPPFVTLVGLFVDMDEGQVREILRQVPLGLMQFHGNEAPQFCSSFGRPWIKAVHMKAGVDLGALHERYSAASGLLLDTYLKGVPGGTGESFDWQLAKTASSMPLILAGGLSDENVGEAIAAVRPWAVDVSSGVESAPGIKDTGRISRFVAAVQRADAGLEKVNSDDK